MPIGINYNFKFFQEPLSLDFKIPDMLQVMETKTIKHSKCLGIFAEITAEWHDASEWQEIYEHLTEDNVCTVSSEGKSLCIGDGGSPLVWNGKLIGIASHVTRNVLPDIYTKVYPHVKWITHEMYAIVNA